jgi:hypothetical protein
MGDENASDAIRAEVHGDDFKVGTKFDARVWFEQASELEIIELWQCGWGGDYAADAVARFLDNIDEAVSKVFRYIETGPTMPYSNDRVGFECHVDKDDALRWIKGHRPSTYSKLQPPSRNSP